MDLTELENEGILWLKNPVMDILDPEGLAESCVVRCGTMLCQEGSFCSGGYCFLQTSPK